MRPAAIQVPTVPVLTSPARLKVATITPAGVDFDSTNL
jgi:hypothetical protein